MSDLLRTEKICKRFGDFYANRDISLSVKKGEIHTLLGENGAGKSTLMNILIGLYQPTSGKIYLNDKEVHITSPSQAVSLGIGMVHQHFMLIDAMTVFDNIILGDRKGGVFVDRAARRKEIEELAERYGFNIDLDKMITEISVGEQQRVEIIKALYKGAELLILDEPTAALTDIEVEGLFEVMKKLVAEGKSIIFISHKMREVLHISDRITILRAGEAVRTLNCSETNARELASLMIGHDLADAVYEKKVSAEAPAMTVKNVSYHKASKHNGLNNVSLELRPGEILGVAGVDGNGQTQLAQVITGVIKPEEGEVSLVGKNLAVFDASHFIDAGTAHVPEDRNLQGLVSDMTISDNLVLKSTDSDEFSLGKGLFLKAGKIRDYARRMAEKYDIRMRSIDQDVRSLSGGNQQKVILARELESSPDILVAVHPTRGLDIGAARFVRDEMIQARDNGVGIVLFSADFDEIIEMSDRIVVMFEGEIMGEFPGIDPPIDDISLAMTGKTGGKKWKN